MSEKPSVIIMGGLGFIGRNLVTYLVENDLCSKIRAVDKVPPQTAWLNERHKQAFENSSVEFKSANLVHTSSAEKAFQDGAFDFCINLAAETKYGQTEEVYEEGVLKLSLHCANEAAKHGVKRFIEVSTGQIYAGDKKRSKEASKTLPWTLQAKYKLKVEEQLAAIEGLNFVIVRPAIVYGLGDKQGLTPRLIIGAVYKQLGEEMKLLWTKDLRMNTIHVDDVSRALWHLTTNGNNGEIYNLVDDGETTQGIISELVCELLGIKHDYHGTIISNFARLNMSDIVDESNEKHLEPWSEACQRDNIENTPLSPYLDQELLYEKHLSLDGSKLEQTGFKCEHGKLTTDNLKEVLQDYVKLGLFPSSLAQTN
ncbi:dTDP-glucose 4,6-dehydratase 2-like [Xenia sp. Carnegie-2017]|uniref:dTDP-glucose 4,6-dehydratase 2-like n=1 Tax=Xenia sp. Carnegie-2017 TaxID=2897299 RepID=UPI001F047321|nr:dTDP-glucose 4,6-dehydratase 2-like [Xenia sp. Carnegie-2017]